MPLPQKKELRERAKELRKNMTSHEWKLWYLYLSKYPAHFLRQKIIKGFIVDFFCVKALLVIELDGSPHYTRQGIAYDKERTNILMGLNVDVIRFSNDDIEKRFEYVCNCIDAKVKDRINKLGTIPSRLPS